MNISEVRRKSRIVRKKRIRKKINGTAKKPRVSLYRSNSNIFIQLIDDEAGSTIAEYSTLKLEDSKKNKTEAGFEAGKKIAEIAKEKGIEDMIFDRSGYIFHGRVKAVADGIRKNGINL
ncbi:MAG: 50S ribosomal protein L18 [Fibrobacterota bacterium]